MASQNFGLFAGAEVTDAASLRHIMVSTRSRNSFVAGYEGMSEGIDRAALGVDCDQMHSNVYIGDAGAAQSLDYLQRLGVTHVLNAADGNGPGMVSTNARSYDGLGISYLGLPVMDSSDFDISLYFNQAVGFIDTCNGNGKVLIHCLRGRSRSPTVALAYLMIRCNMPAPMAMRLCCCKRLLHINNGFLEKLAELHNFFCAQANSN